MNSAFSAGRRAVMCWHCCSNRRWKNTPVFGGAHRTPNFQFHEMLTAIVHQGDRFPGQFLSVEKELICAGRISDEPADRYMINSLPVAVVDFAGRPAHATGRPRQGSNSSRTCNDSAAADKRPAMTTAKLALRWGERPREPGFVAADVSPLNFRDEFEPAHTGCYHKSTITTAPSRKTRAHRNVSSVRVSFTRKRLAARARPVTPGGGRASEFGFNSQAGSAMPLRLAPNSSHRALCARRIALCTAKTWPGTSWPPSGTAWSPRQCGSAKSRDQGANRQ